MQKEKIKKWFRRSLRIFLSLFLLMNIVAFFHAYRFTHFSDSQSSKTAGPEELSLGQKLQALAFGISHPRPENGQLPSVAYDSLSLQSNKAIHCWYLPLAQAKGTVVLFHGYGGEKSALLDKAMLFRAWGYQTLLVDFMGSGGSEGSSTSIGYLEAEQVKTCYDYLQAQGEEHILLFGTSMGAVAIMKALHDYPLEPAGIILECPFGSLYQTVCARFYNMDVPTFPMAGLLVFWGGLQQGFWAFKHQPVRYATQIHCPTLLLYGAEDKKVSRKEIDEIFEQLAGPKTRKVYPDTGHEDYLTKQSKAWKGDVKGFLEHLL